MSGTGQGSGLALIVGTNIRRGRDELNLKQRELASRLQIGAQQISDWERGAYRPSDTNLLRLADAFGKDIAWFYTDHDQVAA